MPLPQRLLSQSKAAPFRAPSRAWVLIANSIPPCCRSGTAQPPHAFLQNLFRGLGSKQRQPQQPQQRRLSREEAAVSRLLAAIEGCERGLTGSEEQRAEIMTAVDELRALGSGSTTTGASELSATWRLLWTTEKE